MNRLIEKTTIFAIHLNILTMSKGNVLLGALAGLAVGAILGVLFAPAKGTETRQKMSEKGSDFADLLKKKFDDLLVPPVETTSSVNEEK